MTRAWRRRWIACGIAFAAAACAQPASEPVTGRPAVATLIPAAHAEMVPEPWARYPLGSRLVRIDLERPDAAPEGLAPEMAAAGGAAASHDAQRLLFVGKRDPTDDYGVWTCAHDGSGLRKAVEHAGDCGSAAFLPDGRIVFAAAVKGVPPHAGMRSAWALFVAPGDGSPGARITFSGGADLDPTVLADGRVLYSGWQQDDAGRPGSGGLGLFTVHPDGTGVAPFHGHRDGLRWKLGARQDRDGTLFFVAGSDDGTDAGRRSVRGTDWRGPFDGGFAADADLGSVTSVDTTSDGLLVVTALPDGERPGGLFLLQRDGKVTAGPFLSGADEHVVHVLDLAPRARPQGHLSMVAPDQGHGVLFCVDARPPGENRATAVRLTAAAGRVLGDVALKDDGSFFARVPSDTPLLLDLLDDDGRVLVRGVTPFWVRPNESRGCVGCHEHPETAPPNRRPLAVLRGPGGTGGNGRSGVAVRRRALVRAGMAALVLLGGLAYGGRALATKHVMRVTGTDTVESVNCAQCHFGAQEVTYTVGARHPAPWDMALSPDGSTIYIACGPTRSVAVLDVASRFPLRRMELDGEPRGVAVSPDGSTLCVSLATTNVVAFVDTDTLAVRAVVEVGTHPAGLSFGGDGKRLFVANAASGDVSVVDVATATESHRVAAGREPFAVTTSPDGATVAVVSRSADLAPADEVPSAEVTLLDARGVVTARVPLPSCHLAEDAAFTRDGARLLVPAIRTHNLLPITQVARGWVLSNVLAVVEVATGRVALMPLNDANASFPDPSGIAVSADGKRAYVASGGADLVCEVDLDALIELEEHGRPDLPEQLFRTRSYVTRRTRCGRNPRGVVVADDMLVVAERLEDSIAFLDGSGATLARVRIGARVDDDAVHRGERVFHDATYAFQSSFSCRSCHPENHTDGLTYDFDIDGVGRNVLLNRSLRGVKGTAPFKWVGLNPTLERQCGARFAMVLTRADPFPQERLDDLVAYLHSLEPPRPVALAGRVGGRDTGALARGRALYERTTRKDGTAIPPAGRCVTCHPPPHYTNKLKADVGTQGPRDDHASFDVPHLTGIASKAPYLHDGRATTLEEIWTLEGVGDSHGVVTDLTKSDLNDLIEFLKTF